MVKKWWMLLAGIVIGLMSAGVILVASRPPQGVAILLRPPPTPAPLVIYVTGAISEPGVYTMPINSHVEDAVQEAGGMTEDADGDSVNLAEPLQDGMVIHIPQKGQPTVESDSSSETADTGESQPSASPDISYPININKATQAELETLSGIGPVTAQKIIEYRQENAFEVVEDIQKVSGIGPATFEKIKDSICVETGF